MLVSLAKSLSPTLSPFRARALSLSLFFLHRLVRMLGLQDGSGVLLVLRMHRVEGSAVTAQSEADFDAASSTTTMLEVS